MLVGEFEVKITENNRLALPSKFRRELGDKLIVTNGFERCLMLLDMNGFKALTKVISEGRFSNVNVRDVARYLLGSAHEITLDKQGRFVLPQSLKEFAAITDDECVFIGLLDKIEIWSKSKWLAHKNKISSEAEKIINLLDKEIYEGN